MRCHAGTDGHPVVNTSKKVKVSSLLVHGAKWALLDSNVGEHTPSKHVLGCCPAQPPTGPVTWREVDTLPGSLD